MPERKHTPGPWHAPLIGGDHATTGTVLGSAPWWRCSYRARLAGGRGRELATAIAHLIAAAPDMLSALEQLVFRAQLSPEDAWIETAALNAIAKAKGNADA